MKEELQKEYQPTAGTKLATDFNYKPKYVWQNIRPADSKLVQLLTWGEGYHNYHHAFPSDYRTSELGIKLNIATKFIELLANLGLAYDLRSAPEDVIKRKMLKSGDGSRSTLYSE
ncbi:Desaturase 2 [Carabus blaptoides fortunei]